MLYPFMWFLHQWYHNVIFKWAQQTFFESYEMDTTSHTAHLLSFRARFTYTRKSRKTAIFCITFTGGVPTIELCYPKANLSYSISMSQFCRFFMCAIFLVQHNFARFFLFLSRADRIGSEYIYMWCVQYSDAAFYISLQRCSISECCSVCWFCNVER